MTVAGIGSEPRQAVSNICVPHCFSLPPSTPGAALLTARHTGSIPAGCSPIHTLTEKMEQDLGDTKDVEDAGLLPSLDFTGQWL